MRSVYPLQNAVTKGPAAGTLSYNIDFVVPNFAVGLLLNLNVSAMGGTTPLLDMKLQRKDPISGTFKDVVGASIVQLSAAANIVLNVDPRIGVASANVTVIQPLSRDMRIVFTLDNTTGNSETYTFSLAAEFYS